MPAVKYCKTSSDVETEIEFTENGIYSRKTNKKLLKIIACVAVFLFIFCIVLAALYANEKLKSQSYQLGQIDDRNNTRCNHSKKIYGLKPTKPSTDYPITINTVKGLIKSMDFSQDPCEDFYQYACGGWIKKNEIPDTRSRWSQFSELYRKNENVLKKLLTSEETRSNYTDNEAVTKAFRYYDACMNEDEIEKLAAKPLDDVIALHGSWSVRNNSWNASLWNFMDNFINIQKRLGIAPLFSMYVSTDLKNSTQNVIILDQPSLSISREAFLLNTSYHRKIRTAYKKFMGNLVKLLYPNKNSTIEITEIYNFEKKLAKMTIPRELRRDSNKLYQKMTLREFIKRVGNQSIDWHGFLQNMFTEAGYSITLDQPVVVYAEEYLKNMSLLYSQTEKRVIANYIMWQIVRIYARSLSKNFRNLYYQYNREVFGTKSETPRWEVCISSVNRALEMAMGLLFVEEKFNGASKLSAEKMILGIREVFIKNLKTLDWMDEETKKVAEEKAKGILENIGYPNYISNKTALALEYAGLDVDKNRHFQNTLNQANFSNLWNFAQITKPVNRLRWSMGPPVVNAYYSPTKNKIVFPAGILQDPFFDQNFPKSLNYGGIGMVVGHEITHGFDDNGRKFNKEGNLVKWWSNTSIENFKKKIDCLVDQYGNYSMFGKKLNGKQTLGENIADNGGIKQSYEAYQTWVAKHGKEAPLPGLDLTHNQLFFVSFAQIWCSSWRKNALFHQLETGVHSPGKFRVIGSLSNMAAFSEAFKCPSGTPMNKKDKCSVW